MRRSRTLFGVALAVYAFLYVPLVLVAVGSFNAARLGSSWT